MHSYLQIDFAKLPLDQFVVIEEQHYCRTKAGITVFGNVREFPVPAGRLVSTRITLVTTVPDQVTMHLPEGQVIVRDSSGAVVEIGDSIPAQTIRVETPNAKGVSNWAGIELCFEATIPLSNTKERKVWIAYRGCYSDHHVVGVFSSKEKLTAYIEEMRGLKDGALDDIEEHNIDVLMPPAGMHSYVVIMTKEGNTIDVSRTCDSPQDDSTYECWPPSPKNDSVRCLRTACWARNEEHAMKIANERRAAYLVLQMVTVPA